MKKNIFKLYLVIVSLFSTQVGFAQADEVLNSIIQFMPSPVEITSFIKETGVLYKGEILNKTTNQKYYTDAHKQALNLGVYSTDLGYSTIYTNPMSLSYLNCVKTLADSLKVGQYINIESIRKLALGNDLNQLLSETSATFEKINTHLIDNKTPELAAFMLVGGWLETVYLTSEIAKSTTNNELLNTKVIEQKFVLDQLIEALDPYKKNPFINDLLYDLKGIKVKMDVAFKKNEDNGKITTADLSEVVGLIEVMREKIIL